ncbi:regulator of G-protein signaling domain-containing protein [Aspergillus chevalieri]|uniref:RGS domain-containing protein n=1 Tax=Aspergillus chevalieri TaxID=182096 RepID=A0A7R7VMA7_ASPCH|nr:uncharacterized protein ACHE_31272S [Aspergillus chevalieri]BCR87285.1 hypothetical protein ACHE_31272S [Aspergillus chevalieri]
MNSSFYHIHPKLDDLLDDKAPYPYTLSALIAFLSKTHCLEILEFVLEARRYRNSFQRMGDHSSRRTLHLQWQRILQMYIIPGAQREINISDGIRDDLVATESKPKKQEDYPPDPTLLDSALQEMYDLLHDSILLPFLRSCVNQEREQPRPLSTSCLHHDTWSIDQKEYAHSDIFPFTGGNTSSSTKSRPQSPRPSDIDTGDRSHASSIVFTDDNTHNQNHSRSTFPFGLSSYSSKPGSVSSGAVQSTFDTSGSKELDLTRAKSSPSRRSEGDRHHQEQKRRWRLHLKGGIFRHLRSSSR